MDFLNAFLDIYNDWNWLFWSILYIGVIATIILENRNPTKSLAYILLLIFLPVVGLIVFYFFGRDLRRRKVFELKGDEDQEIVDQFWERNKNLIEFELDHLEEKVGGLIEPARMLKNRKQSVLMEGNQVQLLLNGEEKFPELYKCLKAATHHIHIEYYILQDDDVGKELGDILVERAEAGVEVRLITDGVGSPSIGKFTKRIQEAGAEHYPFRPVRFASLASANYRNHRKIVVIDGQIGFVGGINLSDRYRNNGKHDLFWRDTHIKIEGSAVINLQKEFLLSWEFVSDKSFPLAAPYFTTIVDKPSGGAIVISAASGPDSDRPHNLDCIVSAIHEARKRVRITNPYFIPPEALQAALEIAASSGIEVELILPGISDSWLVNHASRSYIKPLLEAGVKVYLYQRGFVHAKTVTIDDDLAMVGTVNMDIRSFFINFEIAALVYDKQLVGQLNKAFEEDLQHCEKLDLASWQNRPILERSLDSLCRLSTPLL